MCVSVCARSHQQEQKRAVCQRSKWGAGCPTDRPDTLPPLFTEAHPPRFPPLPTMAATRALALLAMLVVASAQAPAPAPSAKPAGAAPKPRKGAVAGFIRTAGNKFVDADCGDFIPFGWNSECGGWVVGEGGGGRAQCAAAAASGGRKSLRAWNEKTRAGPTRLLAASAAAFRPHHQSGFNALCSQGRSRASEGGWWAREAGGRVTATQAGQPLETERKEGAAKGGGVVVGGLAAAPILAMSLRGAVDAAWALNWGRRAGTRLGRGEQKLGAPTSAPLRCSPVCARESSGRPAALSSPTTL